MQVYKIPVCKIYLTMICHDISDSVSVLQPGRPCSDDTMAYSLMDRFAELGGNWLDTANKYSHGQAEQIVGNWLQK